MEKDAERFWRAPSSSSAGNSGGLDLSLAAAEDGAAFIGYEAADPALHVLQWHR